MQIVCIGNNLHKMLKTCFLGKITKNILVCSLLKILPSLLNVNPCPAEKIKMPHPLLIYSQSNYLIQVVHAISNTERQTVQIQISWLLQKPTDLDLHCLQRQDISGISRTRINGKWPVQWGKAWNVVYMVGLGRSLLCQNLKCLHVFFNNWMSEVPDQIAWMCKLVWVLTVFAYLLHQAVFFVFFCFLFFYKQYAHENTCCGYLLVPSRGASNEYPQHMIWWRNKKKNINNWLKNTLSVEHHVISGSLFIMVGWSLFISLSMHGKNFSRRHFKIFYFFFPQKIGFDIPCKLSPSLHEMLKPIPRVYIYIYISWEK